MKEVKKWLLLERDGRYWLKPNEGYTKDKEKAYPWTQAEITRHGILFNTRKKILYVKPVKDIDDFTII